MTGFTVNKHYCQGKLADISLFSKGACACGDQVMPNGCCKNESMHFQLDDEFSPAPEVVPTIPLIRVLPERRVAAVYFTPKNDHYAYLQYKPPAWSGNILTSIQSFLL